MDLKFVLFIYGLSFFTMGIVIWVRTRSLIDNRFARAFGWLAAFALLHGLNEWIVMFVVMEHLSFAVLAIATFVFALSFALLLQFGFEVIGIKKKLPMMVRLVPAILFSLWLLLYLKNLSYEEGLKAAAIWSGYLLGFPGTWLTAYALISSRKRMTEHLSVSKNLLFAGVFFAFYGTLIVIGLEADFFPASILNYSWFMGLVGLPVQFFRTLFALAITCFMVRSLDVFDLLEKRGLATQVEERTRVLEESEDSLIRSQAEFEAMIRSQPDAVVYADVDRKIKLVNPAFTRLFGYRPEEVLGKETAVLYGSPEDFEEQGRLRFNLNAGEKLKPYEVNYRKKNGEIFPSETIGFPVRDRDGHVLGFLGIIRDIIERKEMEEERRRLVHGIEAAGEAIVMTDLEGNIQYVNPAFTRLTGYTAAEAIGQNPRMLQSGRHPRQFYQQMWDTILRGEVWSGEVTNRRKDGTSYEATLSIAPVFNQRGKLEGFVAVQRDVTEQKRVEEELKQRQEAFQSLYESAMTWRGALNDFCDHTVTSLSQLLKVSHVTVERLGSEGIRVISMMADGRLIHGGEMCLAGSPCERVREERAICQYQGALKELFPQDMFFQEHDLRAYLGVPIKDSAGDIIGILHVMDWQERTFAEDEVHLLEIFSSSISHEIERSTIEAQLRQAQKMEVVGQLAGGVAHDFNNMLTAIQGYTDLILMDTREDEPLYRDLMEIRRATVRAADLTRQLLVFSRRQSMAKEVLSVNKTVEDMSKMLQRLIGEDVSLRVELAPDLWNVEADPGQVEQVLMNLAVNARDAMSEEGTLLIRTENVDLDETYCRIYSYARPGRFVCLSVEDIGTGMDEGTLARIFEPFFTTKGVGKGTGLGLSVVYGIVKGHDGWINVYSEPGHGSTFRIYLPAVSSGRIKDQDQGIERERALGGRERILLVEDEERVRELAQRLLEKQGYQVFVASSCEEAFSLFQEEEGKLDLLFTDVILPGCGGFELAEGLKRQNSDLRILFTSGYSGEKIQSQAIHERGHRFIQKPYSLDFLRTVREVLDE